VKKATRLDLTPEYYPRMSIDDDPAMQTGPNRRLIAVCAAVLLVAALAVGVWLLGSRSTPAPAPASRAVAPPADQAPPTAAATPVFSDVAPTPAGAPARRGVRKPKAAAVPPSESAASALALKVDSDVPGASVFVDRNYVGTTPLTTSDVTPGSHVVQVSAPGYENQSNTVDVTAGTTAVMMRFKVVRLNEAIPVIHKHTIGSCEGRLVADLQGLRYDTPNSDHAFSIPFAEVRAFEVDYLKKNLRITRKDGRTFNFTDRNANADALFVFHKKVEAARAKLAAGFAPEK
jgi:hypothetical protein